MKINVEEKKMFTPIEINIVCEREEDLTSLYHILNLPLKIVMDYTCASSVRSDKECIKKMQGELFGIVSDKVRRRGC